MHRLVPQLHRFLRLTLAFIAVAMFVAFALHTHVDDGHSWCWLCASAVGLVAMPIVAGWFLLSWAPIAYVVQPSSDHPGLYSATIHAPRAPPQ